MERKLGSLENSKLISTDYSLLLVWAERWIKCLVPRILTRSLIKANLVDLLCFVKFTITSASTLRTRAPDSRLTISSQLRLNYYCRQTLVPLILEIVHISRNSYAVNYYDINSEPMGAENRLLTSNLPKPG